ncbi:MAG: DNA polymerase elongation subunit (family B) [Bacteroidia bacterium]|jgi:DNA polymerase elongation subunit (family B)
MLDHLKLENILVLDIETVPAAPNYESLDDRWKALWNKKAKFLVTEDQTPDEVYDRAGIYAEFGRIVCISVGVFYNEGDAQQFKIKSFYGHDEVELLTDFCNLLNMNFTSPQKALCGHNGKEFDFPFLARRILTNGLKLPYLLNTAGKKPWEVNHVDTMQLWKFGDFKSYTSLDLLAALFDIPTPKDDIDGSMVYGIYYEENDLERIRIYCQKDVMTLANVLLKFKGQEILQTENVHITN